MSEGFARAKYPEGTFYSAGMRPAVQVNPSAITVMAERGIDISTHKPEHLVDDILATGVALDYVRHIAFPTRSRTRPHSTAVQLTQFS